VAGRWETLSPLWERELSRNAAQDMISKSKPEDQAQIKEIVSRLEASDPTAMCSDPVLKKRPRYLVGSSDGLQVSFPVTADFDQTVTVQPGGYIHLRGAGDV